MEAEKRGACSASPKPPAVFLKFPSRKTDSSFKTEFMMYIYGTKRNTIFTNRKFVTIYVRSTLHEKTEF